jgi:predicted ATPase/tRNA A-37 threonylcarbamoyl transferase component Bud32
MVIGDITPDCIGGPLEGTRYAILGRLGSGASGEVFLATHTTLDKRLAVKVLRREVAQDPELLDRLRAEARLLARIAHPVIVAVHDMSVTQDGRPFFVMDYIPGESLLDVLRKRRRLDPLEACELMAELLRGLAVAHAQGIVHRDVKPANVLVTPDGHARLVDFGIAKALDAASGSAQDHIVGTPRYMAPEQVLCEPVDSPADLYAVGCVLFELLTGSSPFYAESMAELLAMQVSDPPPTISERLGDSVDPELEAIVARALAKRPTDRPRDASAMASALDLVALRLRGVTGARTAHDTLPSGRDVSPRPRRGNVRELATTFLGRAAELNRLDDFFASGDRLVTVLGPAGCGKTRLAARYAALRTGDGAMSGGVWLCNLTEVSDAMGVVASIAHALGISIAGGQALEGAVGQLGRALAGAGRLLLVLDNCEHVAADAARVVEQSSDAAREALFLATSRQRLGVPGERCFELDPLGLPPPGQPASTSDAVRLFVDRARLVRPDYELGEEDAPVVSAIVRSLDGIPLAIELAAARMRVMSASALLARLDRRLDLLGDRGAALPRHQQTLRAAIDWSWTLLDEAEQATLRQCAVFRGGFTLDAAEAVVWLPGERSPQVLDAVQSLRDKSLVYAHPSTEFPSELRLGLYDSIREYAGEKLADSSELEGAQERHAAHLLSIAKWTRRADEGASAEAIRRVTSEQENLRAIYDRALASRPDDALRAALALAAIYRHRGPWVAYVSLLDTAVQGVGERARPELLAEILRHRGFARRLAGADDLARADGERALRLARAGKDAYVEGHAQRLLWLLDASDSSTDLASQLDSERLRAAGDAFRRAQARASEARLHGDIGSLHLMRGQAAPAREHFDRAIALADASGAERTAGALRIELGIALMAQGMLEESEAVLQRATAALRAVGDDLNHLAALYSLGTVRHERGDLEGAATAYQAVSEGMRKAGVPTLQSLACGAWGALLAARDDIEGAQRKFEEVDALLAGVPIGHWRAVAQIHRGHVDLALARRDASSGQDGASTRHREDAQSRIAKWASQAALSDDVRLALRWLGGALERNARRDFPTDALVVAEDGSWFRPPRAWRIDLGRRTHLRAVLRALAIAATSSPGQPLTREDVLRAGWPGERVLPRAGASRVYVTILELRDLGLRDLLQSSPGGYLLAADVPLVMTTAS